MTRTRLSMPLVLAGFTLYFLSRPAYGYIDPGTTGSLFGILAPLLSLLAVFIGFVLWPFRKVLTGLFAKKTSKPDDTESPENE